MATIQGYTKEKMDEIVDGTIETGAVVGDHLILTTHGGDDIDAGSVIGPEGPPGDTSLATKIMTNKTASLPNTAPSVGGAWATSTNVIVIPDAPAGKYLLQIEAVIAAAANAYLAVWGNGEAATTGAKQVLVANDASKAFSCSFFREYTLVADGTLNISVACGFGTGQVDLHSGTLHVRWLRDS